MKYTTEVTIDLPRQRVVELFDNPDNLPKCQPGLQNFDFLSGKEGQTGAKSLLVYDMDGRRVEMFKLLRRGL